MASSYNGFDVRVHRSDGTIIKCANATIKAWRTDTNVDLGITLTTDSSAWLAAATLNVPAGTLVIFRLENYQGRSAYREVITI